MFSSSHMCTASPPAGFTSLPTAPPTASPPDLNTHAQEHQTKAHAARVLVVSSRSRSYQTRTTTSVITLLFHETYRENYAQKTQKKKSADQQVSHTESVVFFRTRRSERTTTRVILPTPTLNRHHTVAHNDHTAPSTHIRAAYPQSHQHAPTIMQYQSRYGLSTQEFSAQCSDWIRLNVSHHASHCPGTHNHLGELSPAASHQKESRRLRVPSSTQITHTLLTYHPQSSLHPLKSPHRDGSAVRR